MSKILFDNEGNLYKANDFEQITRDDIERDLREAEENAKLIREQLDFAKTVDNIADKAEVPAPAVEPVQPTETPVQQPQEPTPTEVPAQDIQVPSEPEAPVQNIPVQDAPIEPTEPVQPEAPIDPAIAPAPVPVVLR